MIKRVIQVKSTEQMTAKNGTVYLKVTYDDEKGTERNISIFDQGMWNLFNQGLYVEITLEKKGQFWNVTNAEASGKPQETTETSAETDQRQQSIDLSYAVSLAVAGVIAVKDIEKWADVFDARLLGKEIPQKEEEPPPEELEPPTVGGVIYNPPEISDIEFLYAFVAENMKWKDTKAARSWIVNVCKIEESRIDSEPDKVLEEVKALQNWS